MWVKEGESESYSEDKNVSVKKCIQNGYKIRSVGNKFHRPKVIEETFWDVLEKWGGSWMWKYVKEKYEGQDMEWLLEGMKNNSLVWCADGSYKRKVALYVSGAGWMVYCTKSNKSIKMTVL